METLLSTKLWPSEHWTHMRAVSSDGVKGTCIFIWHFVFILWNLCTWPHTGHLIKNNSPRLLELCWQLDISCGASCFKVFTTISFLYTGPGAMCLLYNIMLGINLNHWIKMYTFSIYIDVKMSLPSCSDESIGSKKWLELVQVQDDTDSH